MRLSIDTTQVQDAITRLRSISTSLTRSSVGGVKASLSSFSPANGFRTSGRTLGHISDQSAPEATEAVATFALGIANTLEAALQNAMWADSSLSGLLAGLGETFGSRASMATGNITALVQQLHSTNPETTSFATPPASAGLEVSLQALARTLQQTRAGEAMNASAFWTSNASLLQRAVNDLNSVKHSLQSSAETPWVEQGIQAITQLQNAGSEYAANSTALAQHTAHLGQLAMQEQALTTAAAHAMLAIPDLSLRKAFEHSFLASYSPRVDLGLTTTVPMFNRLLPDLRSLPGGSLQVPNPPLPQTPTFDGSSLPKVVQNALTANGYGDLVQAKSPVEVVQRFGNVNPDTMNSIAAGATPTQAAATAAPSMPPSLAPAGGGAPIGGPGTGSAGAFSPVTVGGVGMGSPSAGQAAAARAGGPMGAGAFGTPIGAMAPGTAAGSNVTGGRGTSAALGTGRGLAGQGAGSGMGTSAGRAAFGTAGGFGAGSFSAGGTGGLGSAGGYGTGANGGYGAAGAAAAPGASATGGSHAAAMNGGRGGAVAAGPMGAAGANQNRRDGSKAAKVKTVTSAVERDGNLKALLGDAPLVLPEVIGHNVKG